MTTMTIRGVISKSTILLLLMAAAFTFTWNLAITSPSTSAGGWTLLGGIGGFIVGLIISFKPTLAPVLAPVYAILEGMLLGGISAWYEVGSSTSTLPSGYDGIVFQAAIGTMSVFIAMLTLYRTRLVQVSSRMRQIVMIAMVGIMLTYLVSFVMSLFTSTVLAIHTASPIGIGFSLIVIGVASFMLLVDFDAIERGVAAGAPKYMEWYGAFALLVTIIWIYLEMLRLLSKLRSR